MRAHAHAIAAGISLGLALCVRGSIRSPVVDSDPATLHISLPGLAPILLALVLGALLGVGAARTGRDARLAPFLWTGLSIAVFLPGAYRLAPFLAAFSGPLLDVVLLSALLVAVGRTFRAPSVPSGAIAFAAFAIYLALGWKMGEQVGLSGDEPHYLLLSYSLLHDGDLEVENNYREEDYARFYSGKIGARLAAGSSYSVHGPGLALLLLPGFALFGLSGVLLTEALIAALVVYGVHRLARSSTGSDEAAFLAAVAFALSAPTLFLAFSAYPELPAALVIVWVARKLLDQAPSRWSLALHGGLVGLLPLFHVKFIPLALILFAALAFRHRGSRIGVVHIAVGAAVTTAAFLAYNVMTTGSADPTSAYGSARVHLENIPRGVAGLLFDQEFGLLPSSPFYLLGLAGLSCLLRRQRVVGVLAALVLLSVLLPGAAHPLWSGGSSPPARFLLPALPLLSVAAASLLAFEPDRWVARASPALVATSLSLAAAMALLPGQPLYLNARDGTGRLWEALSSSWDVTAYLPSVVKGDPRSVAWTIALALLVTAIVLLPKLRLPSFAAMALGCAFIQDLTSMAPSSSFQERWTSSLFLAIPDHRDSSFLELPGWDILSAGSVMARTSLSLSADPEDGDPRHWWSRRYRIPAGKFRILGIEAGGAAVCNGEGCIADDADIFQTHVALSQFRLRVLRFTGAPRLRYLESFRPELEAARSVALANGHRLHGLDDGAYLDPVGFWVKKSSRARFALETRESCARGCELVLANGPNENWVEVETRAGSRRFQLAPSETRTVTISSESELVPFSVSSQGGFRPSDAEEGGNDRRELGVLLRVTAFDFGR